MNVKGRGIRICIIPARGGSKRVPKKNIRSFAGRPMIAWPLEAAFKAKAFDKIVVSTDCNEVKDIAIREGAEVPFMRPRELADDMTPTRDVVLHTISWYESKGIHIETVCCLYATAALVDPGDISRGLELLSSEDVDSYVFTVAEYAHPIERALIRLDDGTTKMLHSVNFEKRTQDCKKAYYDAGQFYLAKKRMWESDYVLFDRAKAVVIPRWRAIDIDTEEDWIAAELTASGLIGVKS